MKRRELILNLRNSAIIAGLFPNSLFSIKNTSEVFFCGVKRNVDSKFGLLSFSPKGEENWFHELDARMHDCAKHPNKNHLALFARRPGQFFEVLDSTTGKIIKKINRDKNRFYQGHGIYSKDGNYLCVSETDFESSAGKIGVYSVKNHYKKAFEINSGGIEPHQIELHPIFKNKIIVANGGIKSHPDNSKIKLNLNNMSSNISIIDIEKKTTSKRFQFDSSWQKNSLRHLTSDQKSLIAVGTQYQEPISKKIAPVVALLDLKSNELSYLEAPIKAYKNMKNYCASVSFDHKGEILYATSPKTGAILSWNIEDRSFRNEWKFPDVAALASSNQNMVFTSGNGEVAYQKGFKYPLEKFLHFKNSYQFDNHMISLQIYQ